MKSHWHLLYFLIFFISCSSPEKEWQKSKQIDTFESYETFISENPEHTLSDSARFLLEEENFLEAKYLNTIPAYKQFSENFPQSRYSEEIEKCVNGLFAEMHDAFRKVKTVNVLIQDTYGERTSNNFPFEKIVRVFFENLAGWEVFINTSMSTDAILMVKSDYHPSSRFYIGGDIEEARGNQYTSARVNGNIQLSVPGIVNFKEKFSGFKEPPDRISRRYTPNDAPFWEIFAQEGSFTSTMISLCKKTFGTHFLVSMSLSPFVVKYLDLNPYNDKYNIRKFATDEVLLSDDIFNLGRLLEAIDFGNKYTIYYNEKYPYYDKNKAILYYVFPEELFVRLISKTNDPRAEEKLVNLIKDPLYFRKRCYYALETLLDLNEKKPIKAETIVPFLIDRLRIEKQREYPSKDDEIVEALQAITRQNIPAEPDQWEAWWNKQDKGR